MIANGYEIFTSIKTDDMNRKTMNRILRSFTILFLVMNTALVLFLLVSDKVSGNKAGLLIQSLILLLSSVWLFIVVRKSTKCDK